MQPNITFLRAMRVLLLAACGIAILAALAGLGLFVNGSTTTGLSLAGGSALIALFCAAGGESIALLIAIYERQR